MVEVVQWLDMLLHVDKSLGLLVEQHGDRIYLILSAIVFAETGLVVFAFLPGDSLLFLAGTFSATGHMHPGVLIVLLMAAAVAGNTLNYWIGALIGHRIHERRFRFINRAALRKTHDFYGKHGGKTVVIARFVPLVRTFAPFVAGISGMRFMRFQLFNLIGAAVWVVSLVLLGHYFGNLPFARQYLNIIVLAGLGAALLPILLAVLWKGLRRGARA